MTLQLRFDHGQIGAVQHALRSYEHDAGEWSWGEKVALVITVDADRQDALRTSLRDATGGKISVEPTG